jgi:glycosyltransferase involved in cell wall biosynthesis
MENFSLVSVIVPVYNGERYLAEALASAIGQTYRPIEIIVVDDGSTDDSGAIARRFGAPVRYDSQSHAGIGAARNRGVELSFGRYLAFLDSDDLWTKDKLARQMAALRADPALDIVFGYARQFYSPELTAEERNKIYCPPEPMAGYYAGTMLIARMAFDRAGRFDTSWRVGEFIDWYARALKAGLKSALLPDVAAERRLHRVNQGVIERGAQSDFLRILKNALDRRRAAGDGGEHSPPRGKS